MYLSCIQDVRYCSLGLFAGHRDRNFRVIFPASSRLPQRIIWYNSTGLLSRVVGTPDSCPPVQGVAILTQFCTISETDITLLGTYNYL